LVVIDGEEETRADWSHSWSNSQVVVDVSRSRNKLSYRIDRTFHQVSAMVVDKDDNLILADQSFLRMYSKDGKSVKECKLGGTAWDILYMVLSLTVWYLIVLFQITKFLVDRRLS
jgi:hypothetical protein